MQPTTTTATHETLGTYIATYGPRNRRWREAWVWPMPGFTAACLLIITGLDWYYYGYTQYGPTAAQKWSQDWLLWGILLAIFTILITTWQILRAQIRVTLFRYGTEVHLPYQAPQIMRWDDFTGISSITIQDKFLNRTLRTRHQLKIFLTHGKPITLDDRIGNLLELITRLKANLYPRLLPGFRARFKEGRHLSFGPISVQTDNITIREKQISWEYISRITVIAGYVIVEMNEQWPGHPKRFRLPVIQIPNLELLLQILQRSLNQ